MQRRVPKLHLVEKVAYFYSTLSHRTNSFYDLMRNHYFCLSGPDKQDDDDLVFEDFARLRLKESEHLGSTDA